MTGKTGRPIARRLGTLGTLGLLLLLSATPAHAMQRAFGYCEDGNQSITTGSLASTTKVQRSYPGCTISVFVSGTATLATIYSDTLATPLANPFTLGPTASGYWFFYADDGHYDVQFSGAGIAAPFAHGDYLLNDKAGLGYFDVRETGAICDGVTNVNAAVVTAIARGFLHLYLPANCLWNPAANTLPNNLDLYGGDIATSVINAVPITSFLTAGTHVQLHRVNIGGASCEPGAVGGTITGECPTIAYLNGDDINSTTVQVFPYSETRDVGHEQFPGGTSPWIALQQGDGDGIYAAYNGTHALIGGDAIRVSQQANDAVSSGLIVTRQGDAIGVRLADIAGSEGVLHTPQPQLQIESFVKQHGTMEYMTHGLSYWTGTGLFMDFAKFANPASLCGVVGTYCGAFTSFTNAGLVKYLLDYQGNEYKAGIDGMWSGAAIVSAGAFVMTGQMMEVSGAAAISTITLPPNTNFINLMGFPTRQSFCIELLAAPGSTWTVTTGGNIAAAASSVAGHAMRLCYDNLSNLFYPQ